MRPRKYAIIAVASVCLFELAGCTFRSEQRTVEAAECDHLSWTGDRIQAIVQVAYAGSRVNEEGTRPRPSLSMANVTASRVTEESDVDVNSTRPDVTGCLRFSLPEFGTWWFKARVSDGNLSCGESFRGFHVGQLRMEFSKSGAVIAAPADSSMSEETIASNSLASFKIRLAPLCQGGNFIPAEQAVSLVLAVGTLDSDALIAKGPENGASPALATLRPL